MSEDQQFAVPVAAGTVTLAGVDSGAAADASVPRAPAKSDALPVLLLHGLTATRR